MIFLLLSKKYWLFFKILLVKFPFFNLIIIKVNLAKKQQMRFLILFIFLKNYSPFFMHLNFKPLKYWNHLNFSDVLEQIFKTFDRKQKIVYKLLPPVKLHIFLQIFVECVYQIELKSVSLNLMLYLLLILDAILVLYNKIDYRLLDFRNG